MSKIAIIIFICFVLVIFQSFSRAAQNQTGENQKPSRVEQRKPETKPDDKKKESQEIEEEKELIELATDLVTVTFSVTDRQNRYINDLKQEEIKVLEDDAPQEIFSFTRVSDLPLKFALLLDVSGSQEYTLPLERAAAARFFQKVMRPDRDTAAVMAFHREVVLLQDLTSDLSKIAAALDRARLELPEPGNEKTLATGAKSGGTALYSAVYAASDDLLARQTGRRVIILLTDGYNFDNSVSIEEAIRRTWQSEVIIYAIGIGDRFRFSGINTEALRELCSSTGGRAYFPQDNNDLDQAFKQIEDDLRQQYVVAYSPNSAGRSSSFRTIKVEVVGRKDLQTHHRRGYYSLQLQQSIRQ